MNLKTLAATAIIVIISQSSVHAATKATAYY